MSVVFWDTDIQLTKLLMTTNVRGLLGHRYSVNKAIDNDKCPWSSGTQTVNKAIDDDKCPWSSVTQIFS